MADREEMALHLESGLTLLIENVESISQSKDSLLNLIPHRFLHSGLCSGPLQLWERQLKD
jgi:hypothetical protein